MYNVAMIIYCKLMYTHLLSYITPQGLGAALVPLQTAPTLYFSSGPSPSYSADVISCGGMTGSGGGGSGHSVILFDEVGHCVDKHVYIYISWLYGMLYNKY